MELIQGLIQPPKVQSAEETIPTLCDRVENATLINDRRSAVLGLKSFAREYRESVVASGLKPLINTLKRDNVDENSVKAILETLLILFIRGDGDDDLTRSWISQQSRLQNGKYPSPLVMKQEKQQADQFSLWIADAITQSDELVHLLIELLDTGNFYIRLYTIQLLEAVIAARPTRSRNAIISLPTGVSTLVTLLSDIHEPIRDEAILLLMAVVNESSHVQVLVAFENIFEKLFSIIQEEGGLRGSIVVNDCLSLIHNILKYNTSNQTLFLETGNLPKLVQVLNEPLLGEEFFWNEQRVVNINTALDIISLTVDPTSSTTPKNQALLLESNVLMIVLRLAFHNNIPKDVRPVALLSASDMIKGNALAQSEFGKIDVPYFDPSLPSTKPQNHLVSIVTLLLNWTFYTNSVHLFSLRVATAELLKSYLYENKEIRLEFLRQQIEEYDDDESSAVKSNLFEAILDYDLELKLNPYKLYFATDFFMYLFESDNPDSNELREMARKVTTGSGFDEEERLGSIQTISELTITSLTSEDIRIPISYITFLIFWLFGDQNAVNDFLANRSTIQSLLSFSYQVEGDDITVKCLVTILLGVSYEFSSKHSPFPRKPYFEYITKTLGKDNYSSRINQFKRDSVFLGSPKEISLTPKFDETGLPQVYFSPYFVTLFNENYYRIKTALLHSCEEEPYTKISYETFEELQGQCHELKEGIKKLESDSSISLLDFERKLHSLNEEHEKLLNKYEGLQKDHSEATEQLSKISQEYREVTSALQSVMKERDNLSAENFEKQRALEITNQANVSSGEKLKNLENKFKNVTSDKNRAEEGINKMNRELMSLTRIKGELEVKIKDLQKKTDKLTNEFKKKETSFQDILRKRDQNLETLQINVRKAEESISSLESEKSALIKESGDWKLRFQNHDNLITKMTEKLKSLSEKCKGLQNEKDSLLRSLQETKTNSSDEMTALRDELSTLSAKKVELDSEKQQLLGRISSLNTFCESLTKEHEKEMSNLNVEMQKLRDTVSDLKGEVEELKTSRDKAINDANQLEEQCKIFQEKLEYQENSNKEADKRYMELEQNFQVSSKDLEKLAKEKKELYNARSINEGELNKLKKQLEDKEQELRILTEHTQELERNTSEQREADANSTRKLRERIEVLEYEKKEALSNMRKLENELELLEKDRKFQNEQNSKTAEELRARVLDVEKQRDERHTNVREIENTLQEKSKFLENIQKSQVNDNNRFKALQDKFDSLSHEKNDLVFEKNNITENFAKVKEELRETKRKADDLKESEKKKNEELLELRKEFKAKLDNNQKRIDVLEKSREEVEKNLKDHQFDFKNYSKEKEQAVKKLEKDKEVLSLELNELKKSSKEGLISRDKQIDDLKAKETKLSWEISQLTEKSRKSQEDFQQLENEKEIHSERSKEQERSSKIDLEEKEKKIKHLQNSEKNISSELSRLQKSSKHDREEVESVKKDLQEKIQTFEKERKLLNEGSDAVTKQYSERITVLEDKLQQIELEIQKKNKELEAAHSAADESGRELRNQLEEKVIEISSLKSTISEQEKVINRLEKDLKDSTKFGKKEVEDLNRQLEAFKVDISEKEMQIETNKNDLQKKNEERKELEHNIVSLQEKLESSSKTLRELEDNNNVLTKNQEHSIQKQNANIENLEAVIKDLQKKDEDKSNQFAALESEKNSIQEGFDESIRQKESTLSQFKSQTTDMESLKRELEEGTNKLERIEIEKKTLDGKINETNEEKKNIQGELEEKLKAFESSQTKLEEKVDELKKREAEQGSTIKKLEKLLDEKEESISAFEVEISNLTKSNKELKAELERHAIKLSSGSSFKEKNQELESELETSRKDVHTLKEKLKEMKDAVYQHEENKHLLTEEKKALNFELEQACKRLQDSNTFIEEKQKEFGESEKRLKGECDKMKFELDKLKQEASISKENGKEMNNTNEGGSEIDDLMLLVSDLDEKNAKYKAKLKELGVELSSDEDDEDEDDNE